MSAEEIAKAFVNHFYQAFDSQPAGLQGLFSDASMMTFEGTQVQGGEGIMAKINSLGRVSHTVKTIDVQPSQTQQAICIFVTGAVKIGDDGNPLHFCEFFQLVSTGANSYYVHNDIFRLNYGL